MKENSTVSAEQARQFFLDRLQKQASAERTQLTKIELQYLDYGRITSDEASDRVENEFAEKFDDEEFAERVARLTRAALEQDRSHDPKAPARYRQYLKTLEDSPEDGQLFAFVAPALGHSSSQTSGGARRGFWLALGGVLLLSGLLIAWDAFTHR
ncbi:MAG TPA: hypothetical protein VFI72_17950 [Candidatus Angelobacter sp.]|nr:hypothetical protein [Candidatus Angelobacter sp.]